MSDASRPVAGSRAPLPAVDLEVPVCVVLGVVAQVLRPRLLLLALLLRLSALDRALRGPRVPRLLVLPLLLLLRLHPCQVPLLVPLLLRVRHLLSLLGNGRELLRCGLLLRALLPPPLHPRRHVHPLALRLRQLARAPVRHTPSRDGAVLLELSRRSLVGSTLRRSLASSDLPNAVLLLALALRELVVLEAERRRVQVLPHARRGLDLPLPQALLHGRGRRVQHRVLLVHRRRCGLGRGLHHLHHSLRSGLRRRLHWRGSRLGGSSVLGSSVVVRTAPAEVVRSPVPRRLLRTRALLADRLCARDAVRVDLSKRGLVQARCKAPRASVMLCEVLAHVRRLWPTHHGGGHVSQLLLASRPRRTALSAAPSKLVREVIRALVAGLSALCHVRGVVGVRV
mmetsp:Transcript_54431/g.127280  ORF Transcript_54431/g.127280 Transcript_54431/m.127280 type:complete len:397 (+) Transcript_54431:70-1260(+)